jgi:hypothetical protein
MCAGLRSVLFLSIWVAVLAVGCKSGGGIEAAKFEGVNRAAKTLEISISSGVTNEKLRDLLQSLGTEISIAKDRVNTDLERALLVQYEEANAIYLDSLRLWDIQIAQHLDSARALANLGLRPLGDPDGIDVCLPSTSCRSDAVTAAAIAGKYNLPVSMHKGVGKTVYGVISESSSVQNLWKIGGEKLDACNAVLNRSR